MAFLKLVRRLPLVRSRVIPWLVREEIHQIPAAHTVLKLRDELARIARTPGPILIGPWVSEVGFELLYWIPFLNWATREFGLNKERLIAVSRGGAGVWYSHLCDRSVDLFDLFSVEEYRTRNAARWLEVGNQKQLEVSPNDSEIVELVRARLGHEAVTVLHPSLMYTLYRYYWYEKGSISLLRDHSEFRPLPNPGPPLEELPPDYVAVRFYFRPSFPDTPDNRLFVASTIRTLASHVPVVLLNTGLNFDDHDDFAPDPAHGVYTVHHRMTPGQNLETQTRIIANARAFVGTYGGLAYLGPLHGVPSVGVYSDMSQIVLAHLDVTDRLCRAMDTPLVTLDVGAAGLMRWVFDSLGRDGPDRRAVAPMTGDPGERTRT